MNRFLDEIEELRVGGMPLRDFLVFEDVSLWQFLPSWCAPAVFRTIELVRLLDQLVAELRPSELRYFPIEDETDRIWVGVIESIGNKYGIPVQPHKVVLNPFRKACIAQSLRSWGAGFWIKQLQSFLDRRLFARKQKEVETRKTVVCATLGLRHWVKNPNSGRNYDEQFFPLLEAFRTKGWDRFLLVDCLNLPSRVLDQRNPDSPPDVCWRNFGFYSKLKMGSLYSAWRFVYSHWQTLKRDSTFSAALQYEGVSLWPALECEFRTLFFDRVLSSIYFLKTAKNLIRQEQPSVVVATYETGPWERALLIEAKKLGIPTVGLQHGMIFGNHTDYMHARLNVDQPPRSGAFVVPDVTCVWGSFWKNILLNPGRYPDSRVAITGNWRWDGGPQTQRAKVPQSTKKQVAILPTAFDVNEFVRICLSTLRSMPECSPLIRLHPACYPALVVQTIRACGFPDDILVQTPLNTLLLESHLVIGQFSTVIGEALLMDRPVILGNFQNRHFTTRFHDSGACLYVTRSEELGPAIVALLKDPAALEKLERARQSLVQDMFYDRDGQAAVRVADAVESVSRSRA